MFEDCGWMNYLLKLSDYDDKIAITFLRSLKNDVANVKDLRVELSETIVAEVTRLPIEGDMYPNTIDAIPDGA